MPCVLMAFIVTTVAMLRERTSGTLERPMSMPVGRLDPLAGYAAAFALVALAQTGVAAALILGPLGLDTSRSPALLLGLALDDGLEPATRPGAFGAAVAVDVAVVAGSVAVSPAWAPRRCGGATPWAPALRRPPAPGGRRRAPRARRCGGGRSGAGPRPP